MNQIKNHKYLFFILFTIIFLLFNGCARWPDDPNGGNGQEQKLLRVRVDINSLGTINTNDGQYYLVFDIDKDAPFKPGDSVDEWETGFYYVKLDIIGFFLGEVLEVGTSEQMISGTKSDNFFQVTIPLADLGDPEGLHLNVVTTDLDNETYDALDPDFYIDTNVIFSKTENDFIQDSSGGADFDIAQVTTDILIP